MRDNCPLCEKGSTHVSVSELADIIDADLNKKWSYRLKNKLGDIIVNLFW